MAGERVADRGTGQGRAGETASPGSDDRRV